MADHVRQPVRVDFLEISSESKSTLARDSAAPVLPGMLAIGAGCLSMQLVHSSFVLEIWGSSTTPARRKTEWKRSMCQPATSNSLTSPLHTCCSVCHVCSTPRSQPLTCCAHHLFNATSSPHGVTIGEVYGGSESEASMCKFVRGQI